MEFLLFKNQGGVICKMAAKYLINETAYTPVRSLDELRDVAKLNGSSRAVGVIPPRSDTIDIDMGRVSPALVDYDEWGADRRHVSNFHYTMQDPNDMESVLDLQVLDCSHFFERNSGLVIIRGVISSSTIKPVNEGKGYNQKVQRLKNAGIWRNGK